jgi:hypothetical protein
VLTALLALDREHHDLVARILERCSRLDSRRIEDEGGLYEVLTESESLEADVAGAREDRRAEAGYVPPAAAAAFLAEARKPIDPAQAERDPSTKAYFRQLAPASPPPARRGSPPRRTGRWVGLVDEPVPQLGPADGAPSGAAEPLLPRTLRALAEQDVDAFAARSEELAYLANVLAAGASFAPLRGVGSPAARPRVEGGRLRPALATRAAIAYVSLGLELAGGPDAVATLRATGADVLFRVGYAALRERSAADCPTLDGAFIATKADLDRLDERLLRNRSDRPTEAPARPRPEPATPGKPTKRAGSRARDGVAGADAPARPKRREPASPSRRR